MKAPLHEFNVVVDLISPCWGWSTRDLVWSL